MDITYNDVTASSLGAIVTDISPPVRAARRVRTVEVPGRSGVLHIDDGSYAPVTKTVGLGLVTLEHLEDIHKWLSGSGTLVCSTEPERAYLVHQVEEVSWNRIGRRLYQAVVRFECEPFRYLEPAAADIELTEPDTVTNPGTAWSEPLLVIEGSGDISLTVGNQVISLTGITDEISLDCAAQIAFKDDTAMDSHISGSFPRLLPGENEISWTGTIAKLTITPRWRFL
jgi:phage-related protein